MLSNNQSLYNSYLFSAITSNDAKEVNRWLSNGAEINAINPKGEIPVFYAVRLKHWNCVRIILTYTKEKISGNVLKPAIQNAPDDVTRQILAKGCDLERHYDSTTGYYALHCAISKKKSDFVKIMLDSKANPSKKTAQTDRNHEEITPFTLALRTNQPQIIQLLLKASNNVPPESFEGESPLLYAVKNKYWGCVKLFVDLSLFKNDYSLAFNYAVEENNNVMARMFMSAGVEFNAGYFESTGFYSLHTAIQKGNFVIIAFLLENKVNPSLKTQLTKWNSKAKTPLEVAIDCNQPEAISMLLDAKADANVLLSNDKLPIMYAADLNYWDCVNKLIRHHSAQYSNEVLENLLIPVVSQSRSELLPRLLESQLSVNRVPSPRTGFFPLHIAVDKNNIDMTKQLLVAKADPFMTTVITNENKLQLNPLDIALKKGWKELIQIFIDKSGIKDKTINELCFDASSYRATYEGMSQCLEYYQFMLQDVLQYIQQKKDHESYFLCVLAFFHYQTNKQNPAIFEIFKDVQPEGHRYLAKSVMEVVAFASESNQKFYQAIPELSRQLLKYESKKNDSSFATDELVKLIFLKDKYIKLLRDKVIDIKYINFDKTIIPKVSAINDILDRVYCKTYDLRKIENQLKFIYGESSFYSGFFYKNQLLESIREINIWVAKQNWTIEKTTENPAKLIRPPQYNPSFQKQESETSEEPGSQKNPYLDMNFFEAKSDDNRKEGEGELQVEGRSELCHASRATRAVAS